MKLHKRSLLAALCGLLASAGCGDSASRKSVRIGHFPNVTHAHGLIAHNLSRQQKGWFEQRLGNDLPVEWFVYNAGPSAMEAILTGELDATYVGPSPALNAYIRSHGEEVRVIAGATKGGAALVVRTDAGIEKPADFRGKKIATPQLGNTQDVACRAWLRKEGFKFSQTGGDVSIIPTNNPDQLQLFQQNELDAAWTVEPWVSRLVMEAKGKIFLEENDAVTTVLVVSARFLREHPDRAKKLLDAHLELSQWIQKNPAEAKKAVRDELTAETTREMSEKVVESCWPRMKFDPEISTEAFQSYLGAAMEAGFLQEGGDLRQLVVTPR